MRGFGRRNKVGQLDLEERRHLIIIGFNEARKIYGFSESTYRAMRDPHGMVSINTIKRFRDIYSKSLLGRPEVNDG